MALLTKTPKKTTGLDIRGQIVGIDTKVPLLDGNLTEYVNFDNAASTPVLAEVLRAVNDFMPWYSSVHRGSGFKSVVSTEAYEQARQIVGDFFGANARDHTVIFGKNSTEALNKLSYRIPLKKDDIVLVSLMEHHSNDLPWRGRAHVERVGVDGLGRFDENHLEKLLAKYKKRVKLVTLTGASNVTGQMPDVHAIARKAHAVGAQILVDAAQLAPHRQINIKSLDDPEHLDYIVVSAHKMYAPFGTGAIVGRKDTFTRGEPEYRGGGTINLVTTKRVDWADCPDRDEAGSPNVVGAVAFAAGIRALKRVGMAKIAAHEAELTSYALAELNKIAGIQILGDANPANTANRLGVIPFNAGGLNHSLVAAILGAEFGIGVRSGCFCAHPYVACLLKVSKREMDELGYEVRRGDKRHVPGLVRASFGMYNTLGEVDKFAAALSQIAAGKYKGKYQQHKKTGDFSAAGWPPAKIHLWPK
ncbi:MAG: aminotransferase class V-fold PLP-dependent enzyme [bacterium]|nr:aminotransferase class V-fold PLP-dependent enzyme [bacterium]